MKLKYAVALMKGENEAILGIFNSIEEADKFGFENSAARILFLADNHDTRFDAYSVLRPLEGAH